MISGWQIQLYLVFLILLGLSFIFVFQMVKLIGGKFKGGRFLNSTVDGYSVTEDWSGDLSNWTPYYTQDTTEDIDGDYSIETSDPAPSQTYHLQNDVNHSESEVLIYTSEFPDTTKAGHIKGYLACGGTSGSVRVGFIYGGEIDGNNDYDTGVIIYCFEDQSLVIGHMVNGGTRASDDSDDFYPVLTDYYYYVFWWDAEAGGSKTFYAKVYDSPGGSELASVTQSFSNTQYPTGQWGIFLSNAGNNTNNWGTVVAGDGAP